MSAMTTSTTSTTTSSAQQKEVVALIAWLQTFSEFGLNLNGTTLESVIQTLDTYATVRAVENVATLVIRGPAALEKKRLQQENDDPDISSKVTPDQIWVSLWTLVSNRPSRSSSAASPTPDSPLGIKLLVLAGILDGAVQNPDLRQRRMFIEQIMALPKSIQKTLMALIERQKKKKSPFSKKTPTKSTPTKSPLKSALKKLSSSSSTKSPNRSVRTSIPTPTSSSSSKRPSVDTGENTLAQQQQPCTTPGSTASSHTTVPRDNTSGTPVAVRSGSRSSSSRTHSRAFSSPSGQTPEPKRSSRRSSSREVVAGLLSPGTLESPTQVQHVVGDLQRQYAGERKKVQQLMQAQHEQAAALEQVQAAHRKQMIKVEAAALDRQDGMQMELQGRIVELELNLQDAVADSAQGHAAVQELAQARDELEVLRHSQTALQETTERLNRCKEKVAELQDVKEALQREQEAHGKSIDEVVKLENERQTLLPLKRQLDDYKIRAIEAEVKLVETQDYLRRLEQQAADQSANHESLFKGAAMQQEQVEELQNRIQLETQASMDSGATGSGVGDGLSELNPEIQRELYRLRNENLQLRAFAAKRESDSVQKLEADLEDTKLLADRYKQEFLTAKENWERVEHKLAETEKREQDITVEMEQWRERSDHAETRTRVLEEKLDQGREQLEKLRKTLTDTELRNTNLLDEIEDLTQQTHDAALISSQRMERLQDTVKELQATQAQLSVAEQAVQELRSSVSAWEVHVTELESDGDKASHELEETQEVLTETRVSLAEAQRRETSLTAKLETYEEERVKLQDSIEEELQAKHDAAEEAHRSLEATRHLLTAKGVKDMEELQAKMDRLVEDEHQVHRQQSEQLEAEYQQLEYKSKKDFEELQEQSASSVESAQIEAQTQIELLQIEYQVEVEKIKKEADESTNTLVRKGKKMISEAKIKAKAELQALDTECRDLELKLAATAKDKEDIESLLRTKISTLKQKNEFAASQINDLTRDSDEFQEKVKTLEREKYKLQEDNDRYRRQLGGRYGADGKAQAQLEKLQKEYNAILGENRTLKKQSRFDGASGLGAISETGLGDGQPQGYSRGGVNRTTLSQMRQEYEEQLESLNDEKRELIMKNSAASTDVQKAEQRAWEREQELAKLKGEITSLKLAQQRVDFAYDRSMDMGQEGPKDLSFFSAHDGERSPGYHNGTGQQGTPSKSPGLDRAHTNSSPGIRKAAQQRNERESALRNRLSSLRSSPARPPSQVLTATTNRDSEANKTPESPRAKQAADVFGLKTNESSLSSTSQQQQPAKTLMDYTRVDESQADMDGRPECKQS